MIVSPSNRCCLLQKECLKTNQEHHYSVLTHRARLLLRPVLVQTMFNHNQGCSLGKIIIMKIEFSPKCQITCKEIKKLVYKRCWETNNKYSILDRQIKISSSNLKEQDSEETIPFLKLSLTVVKKVNQNIGEEEHISKHLSK